MALTIQDLKVYVPARDFEISKRFYTALGFAMAPGHGGTLDFQLGGHTFRLQDYYVKDWAENFMMVMRVDDAEEWGRHTREVIEQGGYSTARVHSIQDVEGACVLNVIDPSGVLLIFVGPARNDE